MPKENGGQVFPRYIDHKAFGGEYRFMAPDGGMTLRDYFAAHAPTDYHSWFAPRMPLRPAPDFSDHDHPNEPRCLGEWDCVAVNADVLSAYDDERRRQCELQWPYAWADAMLAARDTPQKE